jgi:hypothetical protein
VVRLSDLDFAVELQPKEANWDRLGELARRRVEQLQAAGRRFNWIEAGGTGRLSSFSRAEVGRSPSNQMVVDETRELDEDSANSCPGRQGIGFGPRIS